MIAPDNISPKDLVKFAGLSTSDSHKKETQCLVAKEVTTKLKTTDSVDEIKSSTSTESTATKETSIPPTNRIDKPVLPLNNYPGDYEDEETKSIPAEGFKTLGEFSTLNFPNPAFLVSFFNQELADGKVTLHPWQVSVSEDLSGANQEKKPTSQHPLKYCLVAANGSGKDVFIVAPFAIWFTLTKKRSRVIITSSSGTQLTAQTESYIKDLANKVNNFFGGQEIFKIRQRYIYCKLSGSEIRMFATDEEGKAEGYHPIEPGAEMAIVVNEGKSVSEEIHQALRRCSGYNYWLEVSSPGEDKGDLYYAFNHWHHTKRITSFDCSHISDEEREEDKKRYGETSAYYRSKHLALFTTLGGNVIIPREIVDRLLSLPPDVKFTSSKWKKRYGIDLSAGGDELVISETLGNRQLSETVWRERDTTISADKIHSYLLSKGLPFDYNYIYADDGGIGHSIIDMLVRKGWRNIHRIHNQSPAYNKRHYGNRGAESYDRVKRFFEEGIWNPTGMSDLCIKQLTNRKIKDKLDGSKIFLQPKKEAKANGFESPDRADAFVLSLTGLTIEDYLEDLPAAQKISLLNKQKPRFSTTEIYEHYTDKVTFGNGFENLTLGGSKKLHGSLACAIGVNNEEIEFDPYTNN